MSLSKLSLYSSHCLPSIQLRPGITRNCMAFLFAYQKQQVLEQHVHAWRSDKPAICYFTCHPQVTRSSHAVHSGQHCESSTLHCSEHRVPRLLWRKISPLLLSCPFTCFDIELNTYISTFYLPVYFKCIFLGIVCSSKLILARSESALGMLA